MSVNQRGMGRSHAPITEHLGKPQGKSKRAILSNSSKGEPKCDWPLQMSYLCIMIIEVRRIANDPEGLRSQRAEQRTLFLDCAEAGEKLDRR